MTIERRVLFSLLVLLLHLGLAACWRLPDDGPRCDVDRIRTESLPEGVVGRPYSFRLERNCRTFFTEWRLSGDLPPGMMFSRFDGQFSGTPMVAGEFPFVVSLFTSGFLETILDSRTFSLVVRPAP